jgi:phi LC3 family holin
MDLKQINWKVRIKNKVFWTTIIPAVLVLIARIAILFGVTLNLSELGTQLLGIVEAVFVVLAILGIVVDPTTEGIPDSKLAMTYKDPKKKGA